MKMTIREATLDDIPVIQSIADIAFPATYKDIITPEQIDYMMDMMYSAASLRKQMTEECHSYLIAEIGGKAVGYVSVQPLCPPYGNEREDGLDVFELQKIYVLPDSQGQHIGRFLFDSCLKWIRSRHPEPCRVELHVNRFNKALHFYEHLGMRKLRQGDFPIGNGYFMNDYIMGMDLL